MQSHMETARPIVNPSFPDTSTVDDKYKTLLWYMPLMLKAYCAKPRIHAAINVVSKTL